MYAITFGEDVGSHSRIPSSRLVAEVHAGLQHIAHVDLGHDSSLISRVRPPRIPVSNPCGHPGQTRDSACELTTRNGRLGRVTGRVGGGKWGLCSPPCTVGGAECDRTVPVGGLVGPWMGGVLMGRSCHLVIPRLAGGVLRPHRCAVGARVKARDHATF